MTAVKYPHGAYLFSLFYCTGYYTIHDPFLTENIHNQHWKQNKQIRSKCQIIINRKLFFKYILGKLQCLLAFIT